MDIKLYYSARTRAMRPRWLLEELGVKYRLQPIDLFGGEGQSERYRKIHPLGQVPALEVDGEVMYESGAICHWLADRFSDSGLAPDLTSEHRRRYEQWMYFAPGTLEPPVFYSILHTKILPEQERVDDIVPWLVSRHEHSLEVVNKALEQHEYLLDDQFTAADIMVGSVLMWSPGILPEYPALEAYTQRLQSRDAYKRANIEE